MGFGLVAVDVDGTLLDDTLVLSEELVNWVRRLRTRGVEITLATGRVFPSAAAVAQKLGVTAPLITNGGAVVMTPAGFSISCLALDPGEVRDILAFTSSCPGPRYLLTSRDILSETGGDHAQSYARRLQVPVTIEPDLARVSGCGVTQVVLRVPPEQAERWEREGRTRFGSRLAVNRSLPWMVEFSHARATKGQALSLLAGYLGIATPEVLAIGDGINDLDMLEAAGCGVLVGNAAPELWPRADFVTRSPHYRGVVEALERFFAH
ncbi:MAG: HAD family hydrolase [Bacillota bacterium]